MKSKPPFWHDLTAAIAEIVFYTIISVSTLCLIALFFLIVRLFTGA